MFDCIQIAPGLELQHCTCHVSTCMPRSTFDLLEHQLEGAVETFDVSSISLRMVWDGGASPDSDESYIILLVNWVPRDHFVRNSQTRPHLPQGFSHGLSVDVLKWNRLGVPCCIIHHHQHVTITAIRCWDDGSDQIDDDSVETARPPMA